MATRLLPPGYQQLDANGTPVSGAKLYTYDAGTSTPKATYSDAGLTVANANPVVADSAGRFGAIFATTGDYALTMKTSSDVTLWTADPIEGATGSSATPGAGVRNLLTGSDFSSVVKTTAVATDGGYIADDWYALRQTDDFLASIQTLQQDGIPANLRLTQSAATAQRIGAARIVSAVNSYRARGATVTLSGKIRHSLTAPIRYALLAWTGTADSVTKDVVNDWTSSSYTAANFFLASDVSVVGVGSITPTANTWTDITALSGSVTSSANNLIAFFWTEDTTAQNATLDLSQIQFEVAAAATAYEFLPSAFDVRPRDWRIISTTTVSAAANADIALPSWASQFRVEVRSARPATDGANIWMRTSTNGGSSFDSGASDYTATNLLANSSSATGTVATANEAQIVISPPIDTTTAAHAAMIDVAISPGDGTLYPTVLSTANAQQESVSLALRFASSRRNSATRINAIRFLASSGNISGTFTLFGRP